MNTKTVTTIRSIMTISCKVALVLIPLSFALIWSLFSSETIQGLISRGVLFSPIRTPEGLVLLSDVSWTAPAKAMMCAASFIGPALFWLVLWQLHKLFKNYQQHNIFTTQNAYIIRLIGFVMLSWGLALQSLSDTLSVLAVTMVKGVGHRILSISFGTPQLINTIFALVVIVIAHVMYKAAALYDDHKMTI